jgi:mono/diheme cytochrome c family protein
MPGRIARRAALAIAALLAASAARAGDPYGIGRPATPQEISGWDIDVSPSGAGLPPGHGDVHEGEAVFAEKCAVCHGAQGQGKPMDALVGGLGTIGSMKPRKTVGSFWPYATTLFDYVRRAMPFNAPQSLTPDEVYAVSAYVLFLNGIVPQGTRLDQDNLAKIVMPNRGGFFSDYPGPSPQAKP